MPRVTAGAPVVHDGAARAGRGAGEPRPAAAAVRVPKCGPSPALGGIRSRTHGEAALAPAIGAAAQVAYWLKRGARRFGLS